MNLKRLMSLSAVASACLLGSHAQAANLSYPVGQTLPGFTGFDWAQAGTAFTTGFLPEAGDTFTLQYFAWAVTLQQGIDPVVLPGMDITANGTDNGFGYTIVATLNEQVKTCSADLTTCSFSVLSGSFDIYFQADMLADSRAGSLGTGFGPGTLMLSGSLIPTENGGTFTVSGGGGTGQATLFGDVTYTNPAFISPDLIGTTFGTELKFGNAITNWTNPGGFNNVAFNQGNLVFQADGNQSFTQRQIPEPTPLALLALAMMVGGYATRRGRAGRN